MNNISKNLNSQYPIQWTSLVKSLWLLWEREGWFQPSDPDPVPIPQIILPHPWPRFLAIDLETGLILVYPKRADQLRHREPRGCTGWLLKLVDGGLLKEMRPSWAKILVDIIAHIGNDGWAEVDQKTLAKEAGVCLMSIKNFISRARAAGILIVVRRKRNRYSLGFKGRPKFAGLCQKLVESRVLAKLPWRHVKVLLALYRHRNEEGFAFPKIRLLAEEAGVGRKTVKRFLRRAQAAGLIELQPGENSRLRNILKTEVGQSPAVSRRRSKTYTLTWGEEADLNELLRPIISRLKKAKKRELINI
jgi:DNA-binding MarR family transcriptional regulator